MASNTKRKRSTPLLAHKRAPRATEGNTVRLPDTTPDVRTYRRSADWQGWDFEPPIVFARPVDVRKLLGREDDELPIE